MPDRAVIRGYGGVFRRDRRIYSIPGGPSGRMPLPVHGGVPIRSVGYFAVIAGVMALAARLPVLGALLEPAGWVMKYLGLPGVAAFLLTRLELEGRPPLGFLAGWLVHRIRPRCRSAGRAVLGDGAAVGCAMNVALAPDASLPRLARGRVRGPARVAFAQDTSVGRRAGALCARPVEFGEHKVRTKAIVLGAGEVVEVVP
jgi:hypothetical protein